MEKEEEIEEDVERFKVREQLVGLRSPTGLRRFRLYFTDERVFLVETYIGYAMRVIFPAAPLKMILTPFIADWFESDYDKMDDIRYILFDSTWYRRYTYDELKAIWLEPGKKLNCLVISAAPEKENPTFGIVEGEGRVYFKQELTGEFVRKLERIIPHHFQGMKIYS
ncbi:MAG: hypothetical protein ACMUHB_05870 [Thermoplasmatota archaeon]